MFDVILQAAGLILCGTLWRLTQPLGLAADQARPVLTGVVYVLLLPALVLVVIWRAPLGLDAVRVAFAAAFGVVTGLALAALWYRRATVEPRAVGALLLASAFPNATYLGLPVLEAALGPWARSVAVQYDLFACTPLLLTLGVVLAARFGGVEEEFHPIKALMKVPPLWAAIAAVALNLSGVPLPAGLGRWLDTLAAGVIPLMLFSLGLGLQWSGGGWGRVKRVIPVAVIQLVATPLLVYLLAGEIGLDGELRVGVVLEAAMPSMVLGIVLCDRYGLDTPLYAMAVTVTTAISMATLPAWFLLMNT